MREMCSVLELMKHDIMVWHNHKTIKLSYFQNFKDPNSHFDTLMRGVVTATSALPHPITGGGDDSFKIDCDKLFGSSDRK